MTLPLEQTVEDALVENVMGPAKASGDSGSVEMQDPLKVIVVDRYRASKAAANQKSRGLRMNKLAPPGASEMG